MTKDLSDCYQIGWKYNKGTMANIGNVFDPRTCQELCEAKPLCAFFVFSTAERSALANTCSLKKSNAYPVQSPNVIAGTRDCK